ncbi:hypothetical protein [Fibrella arboris]|uniref:hypothetical protein n=1 Tax=Fibrella arboris TaxID=3242486 RepID=UPI003522A3E8
MIRATYNEGYSMIDQLVQQEVVNSLFPFCKTRIQEHVLFVDCLIQDPDYSSDYQLTVQYNSQRYHKVFIRSPKIIPSVAIHMYPDASLCLYYPPDISPFRRLWVGKDLIPMAALWVCHYEQWLINGNIWKGREAPGHTELLQQLNDQR